MSLPKRWKRRYVFANVSCGSRAAPYEVISSLLERCGAAETVRWENSSATARIIRKINYFPTLLINFTIASMFPFPALLLSRPPSPPIPAPLLSDVGRKENGLRKNGTRNEEGRSVSSSSPSFNRCLEIVDLENVIFSNRVKGD